MILSRSDAAEIAAGIIKSIVENELVKLHGPRGGGIEPAEAAAKDSAYLCALLKNLAAAIHESSEATAER